MEVLISNRQNKKKISLRNIRDQAKTVLSALGCDDCELSVVVTDDPQIEILNMNYLKRKGPTNVIAFPMREGDFSGISPNLLGDVVISVETAEREAFEADISFERHFRQLLVHGILHLLGFDHEKDERSAAEMESKSLELVNMLES